MTLIVYSDGKLYADQIISHDEDTVYHRYTLGEKIFKDSKNQVAFAITGLVPHESCMASVITSVKIIARTLLLMERVKLSDQAYDGMKELLKSQAEKLVNDRVSIYRVISHHHAFTIDQFDGLANVSIIYPDQEDVGGSGKDLYFMCRANGLSVVESYEKVAKVLSSVSPVPIVYSMSDLTSFNDVNLTNLIKGVDRAANLPH